MIIVKEGRCDQTVTRQIDDTIRMRRKSRAGLRWAGLLSKVWFVLGILWPRLIQYLI